jgi:hypothetical protein
MLKFCAPLVFVSIFGSLASAQNFTFEPGNQYYGTLEMDMYTEHYMYIGHDLADSAFITWRLVENTCPEQWDIQACDYQHCYTGLPNYGDMNGVPAGGQGYLRMIVNPFTTPGQGILHFLIYPTGEPLNYTDAFYYLNTTVLSTEQSAGVMEMAFMQANEILYKGPSSGDFFLYSTNGRLVTTARSTSTALRINVSDLPEGMYFLVAPTGNTFRILKPH